MPQIYDIQMLYFSSEGRRVEEFSPLKVRWLRLGLNPRIWLLKAITLPLDIEDEYSCGIDIGVCWSTFVGLKV